MLIKVDPKGLEQVQFLLSRDVGGTRRYYYVGALDQIPVIVVVKGQALAVGQVWDASSGNEKGYPGMCRRAHVGLLIGKLTLQKLVDPQGLAETDQVIPLSYQIDYFVGQFGSKPSV